MELSLATFSTVLPSSLTIAHAKPTMVPPRLQWRWYTHRIVEFSLARLTLVIRMHRLSLREHLKKMLSQRPRIYYGEIRWFFTGKYRRFYKRNKLPWLWQLYFNVWHLQARGKAFSDNSNYELYLNILHLPALGKAFSSNNAGDGPVKWTVAEKKQQDKKRQDATNAEHKAKYDAALLRNDGAPAQTNVGVLPPPPSAGSFAAQNPILVQPRIARKRTISKIVPKDLDIEGKHFLFTILLAFISSYSLFFPLFFTI